ncbi:MAG: hypothetical protein HOP07_10460 [Bacteriovoracaceae bacterium]|nr:hypothetical protein [Bacteriovoracaceae bacterium]
MSEGDTTTLLIILIPFFIFIISIIVYFLFKTRAQKLARDYYVKDVENLTVNLKPNLKKVLSTNFLLIKILPPLTLLLIYLFVILLITLGQGPDGFSELTTPSSNLFKVAVLAFFLMAIGAYLAFLKQEEPVKYLKKAITLAEEKPLFLKLNSEGLTVPVLALVNPAFWQATEKNMYEVFFPISDIKTIEVYPKAGSSPAQYLLKMKGESEYLGKGSMMNINFGVGIRRELVLDHEHKILSYFHDHLGDNLILRDQISRR